MFGLTNILPSGATDDSPHPGMVGAPLSDVVPVGREGAVRAHMLTTRDRLEENITQTKKMLRTMIKAILMKSADFWFEDQHFKAMVDQELTILKSADRPANTIEAERLSNLFSEIEDVKMYPHSMCV